MGSQSASHGSMASRLRFLPRATDWTDAARAFILLLALPGPFFPWLLVLAQSPSWIPCRLWYLCILDGVSLSAMELWARAMGLVMLTLRPLRLEGETELPDLLSLFLIFRLNICLSLITFSRCCPMFSSTSVISVMQCLLGGTLRLGGLKTFLISSCGCCCAGPSVLNLSPAMPTLSWMFFPFTRMFIEFQEYFLGFGALYLLARLLSEHSWLALSLGTWEWALLFIAYILYNINNLHPMHISTPGSAEQVVVVILAAFALPLLLALAAALAHGREQQVGGHLLVLVAGEVGLSCVDLAEPQCHQLQYTQGYIVDGSVLGLGQVNTIALTLVPLLEPVPL